MPLQYPLHKYDEAGRLKPPAFIYVLLLFVCRGLIILIISLSFREDSERLLRIFYPSPHHFYLSLVPILPALIGLYIVSKRSILWQQSKYLLFKFLLWVMSISLLLDAIIQVYMLQEIHFTYSITHGLSLLASFCGLIYIYKSQYLRNLVSDWSRP